ncbi:MAG: hypothetical protein U0836_01380 [Pirellulales bacterium]
MSRVSKVILVASLLVPSPAGAEVPRTAAAWLAVYRERQARFDAVEIESHWQRLSGEDVVEDWDQIFYADDLGRLRLAELGRLEVEMNRRGVGMLTDRVMAYDGSEYRELHKRWEFPLRNSPAIDALHALRQREPLAYQGRIEAGAGEYSALSRTDTPLRWADFWFLVCLMNASRETSEPHTSLSSDGSGVWEVSLRSRQMELGHACVAWINTEQDNHVLRIDLYADGSAADRYESAYSMCGDAWMPASGQFRELAKSTRESTERELSAMRFVARESRPVDRRPDTAFMPSFPHGTWVADLRTKASYRVTLEDDSEEATLHQVDKAAREYIAIQHARGANSRCRAPLRRIIEYGAVGFAVSVALAYLRLWIVTWMVARQSVRPKALSNSHLG